MHRIAKRITGGGFLQTGKSNTVTSIRNIDVLAGVRVHLQYTTDALTLFLDSV